MVMLPEQISK